MTSIDSYEDNFDRAKINFQFYRFSLFVEKTDKRA